MKNLWTQGIIIILLFFMVWLGLYQINWMRVFNVEKVTRTTEEKLGEIFWDTFKGTEKEIKVEEIKNAIDSILNKICESNHINRDELKLHILRKDEVNAFALPNNHLVVFSGLVTECENEAALAGVMCHELAHLELDHVMKKLVKELGLSVLISMTTGSSGDMIKETAKMLSSTAYDRNLEKEADIKAIDYMVNAGLDPEHFATFLFNLKMDVPDIVEQLSWISTHPELEERAKYIIEESKNRYFSEEPILTVESWDNLKKNIADLARR